MQILIMLSLNGFADLMPQSCLVNGIFLTPMVVWTAWIMTFLFTLPPKACGVRDIDDEKSINKQDGIVNKTFMEMLDKLGYDIQITYVKKETN